MFRYIINGISKNLGAIRTGHSDYQMDKFLSNHLTFVFQKPGGRKTVKQVDVKLTIVSGLRYIDRKCAAQKRCNDYFRKLNSRSPISLRQILNDKTLHIYRLRPMGGKTNMQIPSGLCFSWGPKWARIGINELILIDSMDVAQTMLHELAHVAGAPGLRQDPKSLAAEKSLLYCGLRKYYDPNAFGSLDVIPSSGEGRTAQV